MIKYVNKNRTKLYRRDDPSKVFIELLWGDSVRILNDTEVDGKCLVRARACTGFVSMDDLGDTSLLEIYFIDVGQGDGILVVTPDRKHILIDGGFHRKKQPHGKSAADFVDWKFFKDYEKKKIELDAVVCSHCDADHYGGLWDLINPTEKDGLDTTDTIVRKFYHAGVSWWKKGNTRYLGETADGFLINTVDDKASIEAALTNDDIKLQGEWAEFLKCMIDECSSVKRIGYNPDRPFDYLDGFGPGGNGLEIKILGPVYKVEGEIVKLKDLGNDSQNTNGNSVILRLDYGRTRMLLTGDLNKNSQRYLLNTLTGNRLELAADVIKSCHHGSDDCSYEFLECVQASATVISSGDDETHAHPRPNIVAASGVTGFKTVVRDEMVTPLIYSTEISRSIRIGDPTKVEVGTQEFNDLTKVDVSYNRTASGALNPEKKKRNLESLGVVDGIIYGLVNVRTDGEKIICATLNEGKHKWEIKEFTSRF
jgi:beta-lactamase superfamily II metal-dependent hydrolase